MGFILGGSIIDAGVFSNYFIGMGGLGQPNNIVTTATVATYQSTAITQSNLSLT